MSRNITDMFNWTQFARYAVIQFIGDSENFTVSFSNCLSVSDYTKADDGEAFLIDSQTRQYRFKGKWGKGDVRDNNFRR